MYFGAKLGKVLFGLGLLAGLTAWCFTNDAHAAPAPFARTALYLNCDTCSAQFDFGGLAAAGPYASAAAAQAAAEDGSAIDEALREAAGDLNVHCRPCPPPSTRICFPMSHGSLTGPVEWWVVETGGQYFVLMDVPAGSKVWVCCEPHCD